ITVAETCGNFLARYGILWKPFRLFPATDMASRKCSSIRISYLAKLHIYRKKTDEIENHAAQSSILEKIADAIKSVNDTSKESKKDIYKMRDIIIAMGIFYIIAAIVFGKL
ncbi:hypothetical protein, partial [Shewanella algae]|uniref:hypothetical protein n=1 Tax=Shewanella algae TaxID=38313 RepID=UPI001AAF1063